MRNLLGEVDDQDDTQLNVAMNSQQQSSADADLGSLSVPSNEDLPLMAEFQ